MNQPGENVPCLYLSFDDISVLRNVIRGYLAYVRRTVLPKDERQAQFTLLESLYERFAMIHSGVQEIPFFLSKAEIQALNAAITGFITFVRQKVPQSKTRDDTLQDLERFREH
jgi:NifB/MoaA-like Fe-S oxidoreductase